MAETWARVPRAGASDGRLIDRIRLSGDAVPVRPDVIDVIHVGAESLLHDRDLGRVFGLNHAASVVWERIDGRRSLAEIARVLAWELEVPEAQVVRQVGRGLVDFYSGGLLRVRARHVLRTSEDSTEPVNVVFGEHQVTVEGSSHETTEELRRLFREMEGAGAEWGAGWVGVEGSGQGFAVLPEGEAPAARFLPEALSTAKHEVVSRFVYARPDLVWLHAGVVARGERAVALVGDWGRGKSTIIGELTRRGWTYLSDDVAPLDPGTRRVLPFPLRPARRTSSDSVLSREEVAALPKVAFDPGVRMIGREPRVLSEIVFPMFDRDVLATVRRLDTLTAAAALAGHCLNGHISAGRAVRDLCRIAEATPAIRLHFRDAGSAADRLESIHQSGEGGGT